MYLEKWIHNQIRGDSRFGLAGPLTQHDIERYQIFRVNKMLRFVSQNCSFYRDYKSYAGQIKSRADMTKIPFTTADHLAENPYKLLCVSQTGIKRTFSHFTTGTISNKPKKIFFTQYDADRIINSMSLILGTVLDASGLGRPGSRVQIYLPDKGPPLSMARMIAKGVEQIGGIGLIGKCYVTTEEQIQSIKKVKPDMIMGSAFRIWRMTQEASIDHDLRELGVKVIFVTSEYLSQPMRHRLESVWDCQVFHHYGMTEPGFAIGIECQAHDGFHFNEVDLLFEVIDPDTGEILPDGEEGELVFTSLDREGMPLIRYRTGDFSRLISTPCQCGASTLKRIGTLPKRLELIHQVGGGEDIYSSLFDEALYRIPDLVDYRIFLSNINGQDVLTCKIEVLPNNGFVPKQVQNGLLSVGPIARAIDGGTLAMPIIEPVERGTLRRGGKSLKRKIVDERVT
jgi:phenylacetate-coenzyme A ligase PaaK-like adenylate-forming protein